MTITNFNYESSYLPGVICNIVVKVILADGTPWVIEQRCLEYQYTKIGRQTNFGRWTPWWIEHRCLENCYTKLGTWTYFGRWTPQWIKNRCLEYCYTKLGKQTHFDWWTLDLLAVLCKSPQMHHGMYLAAILYSSRKGGNFLLFLNN